MKILIVGDAGSVFIKQFIEYVLLDNSKNTIVLLSEYSINEDYRKFYEENGVLIEPLIISKNRFLSSIPKLRSSYGNVLWCDYIRKKYAFFDLIHVHGLNCSRGNIGIYLKNITKKLVITVWGDEIFRKTKGTLKAYQKYYNRADVITLSTTDMYKAFCAAYGDKYNHKISMNKFAIGLLDTIDYLKKEKSRKDLCLEFGILDPSKKIVFVGHNGREAQRHIEITRALKMLPVKVRKEITLLYTMTYGVKNEAYMRTLQTEIDCLGCDYVILREFLNEEKTAKLRCVCDVMLHAQKTDAFSASLMESLYAGAIIINGSWLIYNDLPQSRNRFVEYDTLEELPVKLVDVLDNFEGYKNRFIDNQEIIRSICSREYTTRDWKKTLSLE